jgi:chemotaxis protein MotB
MQENPSSVYKTLTWLLLLVVIGLYALHHWYSGTLKESLAAQQAKVSEGAQQLKEARTGIDLAAQTEKGLRGEVQGLTGRIETAAQANLAMKGDMEALKTQHAETLAAEQRKAADAYAELQGRFDTATQTVAAMGADILGLKQAQVDAAARNEANLAAAEQQHQARLREVEGQLNEHIAALRTALEGSEPERATLFSGFEQRIQTGQETIAALEATKTDLSTQVADAKQTVAETSRALTETQEGLAATQAELTQTRGELAGLQARHDTAMDKATMDQAALQAKHDAAVEKAAQERSALDAQHAATLDQAAKEQAALKAQHAAALDQATKEQAALQAEHEAAMAQAAKDHADLAARHEAEQTQIKATHTERMGEAQGRITTLSASLAAETAALAALQTQHDNLVAELNAKLADTEQALAGVRSDLSATTQAAAEQKAALEQQIADARGRIATLETTLDTERKQAEAVRIAAEQAHAQAMTFQRGLLTRFSEIGARQTEQGMLLRIDETELRFPVSKANLPKGDLPSLDRIAGLMADYPNLSARIEGHTDASGREETNQALSQGRADAVKQALVERGVAMERMEALGLGETRPIGDNATKAGSRQNRRVEIYVREAAK